PGVGRAPLPAPTRALGRHLDPVPAPGSSTRTPGVGLRPTLAGAPAARLGQRHLGARATRALDRPLRPPRWTAAGGRGRAPQAGRIALPRSQTPRLGSGRDGHGRPRASESVAAGGVSQSVVARPPGRLVRASWPARSLRSSRAPGPGHLAAWAALVARYPAA